MKTSLLLRLEALRVKLGGKSITINSGYRCAKHNAEGIFGNGGLGRYNTFTHVYVRGYKSRW